MEFADLVERVDRAVQDHLGGVDVVYAPETGDPVTVTGVFDERHVIVLADTAGVEQIAPAVTLRLEDLPIHPDDDEPTLTIAGDDYRIRERQPDGMGAIRLLLHRADLGA